MKKVEFAKIIINESGAIDIMLYNNGGECVAFLENYDDLADAVEFAKANAHRWEIVDGND